MSPELELPEGQVPLNSQFYLERSPIEEECYKAILQPGALIRLKAPRRMGKSSLLARIIEHGSQNNCATVSLSFQLADTRLFQDLDKHQYLDRPATSLLTIAASRLAYQFQG